MTYVLAFLFGGLICGLSQLVFDRFNLTPPQILVSLVIIGAILEGFGVYQSLFNLGGAGFWCQSVASVAPSPGDY